ncbi:MAG: dephospho-CoA kinase [Oscillospiraceae bacterium]|nr:dephospho-CoA kinase [Oscillospiraceae bacterium]
MRTPNKPLLVGLTGQTGAGKTTVSRAFTDKGFAVIDCDQVTRQLQQQPEVIEKLAGAFGSGILQEDGSLDRRALAAAAFSEEQQTQKLTGIMYPLILAEIDRQVDSFVRSGQTRILLDAPTLFESGLDKRCQKKVAVLAAEELRLLRIIKRDGLTEEQARARMKAQHKDGYYTIRSDYVLRNNGTEEELYREGAALAESLAPEKGKGSQELRTTLIALALTVGTIAFVGGGYQLIYRAMYPQKYKAEVTAAAAEFSVEPELIYAVIRCESGFDPDAVSSVGAMGLMQITEDAYDWAKYRMGDHSAHTYDDILEPELNIRYGSCLLSLLIEEFGSEETAVAAYHAGMGSVQDWLQDEQYSSDGATLDSIPFPTTSQYVDNVMQVKKIYGNLYK